MRETKGPRGRESSITSRGMGTSEKKLRSGRESGDVERGDVVTRVKGGGQGRCTPEGFDTTSGGL